MKTETEKYENRHTEKYENRHRLKKIYSLATVILFTMAMTAAAGSLNVESNIRLENSIVNVDTEVANSGDGMSWDWWDLFRPKPAIPTLTPIPTPTSSIIIEAGKNTNIGGYTLEVGINANISPREAWIFLSKDGIKLDDKIIKEGETYIYKQDDEIMFKATVASIFVGEKYSSVKFEDISYSTAEIKITPVPAITVNPIPFIVIEVTKTANIGKYTLKVDSISANSKPRAVMIYLYKDGVKLDNQLKKEGETYIYKQDNEILFKATVASIFVGQESNSVKFEDISYK